MVKLNIGNSGLTEDYIAVMIESFPPQTHEQNELLGWLERERER